MRTTATASRPVGWNRDGQRQSTEQSHDDLLLDESLAIPLSFLVLVWAFGGLGGRRAAGGRRL